MDTQEIIEPFTARIVSIFGYDGLPERFMVESKHGWLNEDGFGSLSRAYIFQSRKRASEKLETLYPQAIEVNQ